jgi:GNAT superfamily N-acetyltransferase
VTVEDLRLGSVRDQLLNRYLGFAFGGLHLEVRDISAEIAEARRRLVEFLGREPQLPHRPSRLIHLWVVDDETDEIVGNAAREVGLRGSALVVAHKELRVRPEWRRRGFGSALLAANRAWYRDCGVEFIVMEAEGDGSVFAATRGFDFDVTSYAARPGFEGLAEPELRFAAVDRLIRHPAIPDTVDGGQAQPRESVVAFLARLRALGPEPARQVNCFEQRLPRSIDQTQKHKQKQRQGQGQGQGQGQVSTGDEPTFATPREIATVGQDEPLAALSGSSLGHAVLALTGWSGITVP